MQERVAPPLEPLAVYSAVETAGILRISLRRLRQLVHEGHLRPQAYTRRHRFFGEDLIRFLEAQR